MSTRALIFDPFAGISGDMTVAALLDLGLEEAWLRDFVAALELGDIEVRIERVSRRGISCPHVTFVAPPEQAHRHLRHLLEIVNGSPATERARAWACAAFERIAVAEAAVHGTTVERVHFHEVGALDSILDVLCAMAGFDALGFDTFYTRPVAVGSGWIEIEHGRYPVPAPATARILEGLPLTGFDLEGECTTPTGAAIVATLAEGRLPGPGLVAGRTGFGAGTRDPGDRPNCLRLIACAVATVEADTLIMIQADVDDLAPEYVAPVLEALLTGGALDAVALPSAMKKGRPGLRIEALAHPGQLESVIEALFDHSPTIGVRHWPVSRPALARAEETIVWRGQTIRRKRVILPGGGTRTKPEYEDVIQAARALGLPAWRVRLALGEEDATN